VSKDRWVDRGGLLLVAMVYVAVVAVFAVLVGHGPTPPILALFLAVEAVLLLAGWRAPRDLLRVRIGPATIGRWGLRFAGCLEWLAWLTVLAVSGSARVPAWVAAGFVVVANGGSLAVVLRNVGHDDLDRAKFAFATGMLVPLFLWDAILEFAIPGLLAVAAVFAYMLFRLGRAIDQRAAMPPAPSSERATV